MFKCDIILPVYNNLELTKKCLESLNLHATDDQHLIVVDDCSNADVAEFLDQIKDSYPRLNAEVIHLDPNQGFTKAANAGFHYSRSQYICILNNDTIVTKGWLSKMCQLLERHPEIGLVGPSSNNYGLHLNSGQTIDELAAGLERYADEFVETACCTGFCMVVRREVLDKIGVFDEIFSPGYFEDTDYSRRVIDAGFLCVISKEAYVWHREHSTFSSKEREVQFSKNRKIFEDRWGVPKRIMCLFGSSVKDRKEFVDNCLGLARQGHMLTCVLPLEDKKSIEDLSVHANIRLVTIPRFFVSLTGWFLVLRKTKKRFDHICTSVESFQNLGLIG